MYAELMPNSTHTQSAGNSGFCHYIQFMSVEDWTQDFVQAKKVLYQLSYIPSPEIVQYIEIILKVEGSEVGNSVPVGVLP